MFRKKIEVLQMEMKQRNIHAYYIETADPHHSEYLGDSFKTRQYLSGFTGSAGTLVVLQDAAYLWTDGRYFLQAMEQLKNSGIKLMKQGESGVPSIPKFLFDSLKEGQCVCLQPEMVVATYYKKIEDLLAKKDIVIKQDNLLLDEIWEDRPEQVFHNIWELNEDQYGVSRHKKINWLQSILKENNADAHVISSLEEIAWLCNLRGNDIHCTPVFYSYFYVKQSESYLFIEEKALSIDLQKKLVEDNIHILPYATFYSFLEKQSNQAILIDPDIINVRIKQSLCQNNELVSKKNPIIYKKSIKDNVERKNIKIAHQKDGIAMCKFLYYLKENKVDWCNQLTEISAGNLLESFRKQQEGYLEPSFDPIVAFADHGAIVHYSATDESNVVLSDQSFLLVDTGGHYMNGTTDITRTIAMGTLSYEQKKHYTLVLKGNLNLLKTVFKEGVKASSLDIIARQPLWEEGYDFNHGTGHGVSYLLSVHEGPVSIRYARGFDEDTSYPLAEGMVMSNEPGLYFEGDYGIRLENLMECIGKDNGFLGFQALTLVPFDRSAILEEMLTERERKILNEYHAMVYENIAQYLTQKEKAWLYDETKPFV